VQARYDRSLVSRTQQFESALRGAQGDDSIPGKDDDVDAISMEDVRPE
jgi:hypothetical protein